MKSLPCILTFLFKYLENDICCVSCTATLLSAEKAVNHGKRKKKSKLGTRCKSRLQPGRQETRFYMSLTGVALRGCWQAATPASLRVLQLCDVIYLSNLSVQQHALYKCRLYWRKCEICTQAKTISVTDSDETNVSY